MRVFRRNTAYFEYNVQFNFDITKLMEFPQFLRKFVDTCHRLDITEMEEFNMRPFLSNTVHCVCSSLPNE